MLAIAGAYLLRAVAETSTLPKVAVAWAGIVYAFLWLVWATRTRAELKLASPIYACTSALILAPMLWEITLSFKLFPAPVAAAILGAYALTAFWFAGRAVVSVHRVSVIVVSGLSLALAIASHELLPFIAVLLLMAAIVEFSPWGDRMPETKALLALAADTTIWMLIFIYYGPPTTHPDYPQLGTMLLLLPGAIIFLIAGAGVILETIVRRKEIAIFATIQTMIAFLLAAVSLADFGSSSGLLILGILCLILAVAGYAAVFGVLSESRTSTVFAAWSAVLLLSGCLLCFTPTWTSLWLGIAAVAATFVGKRKTRISFELYGALFLGVAAAESGLLAYVGHSLVTAPAGPPSAAAGLITVCVILCYAAAQSHADESWPSQSLHLAVSTLALAALVAFMVQALVAFAALKVTPGAHHLAFIRTLTLCSVALALVFGGARWRRMELTRLGYAAMALVAVKLVAEDLRHGHLAYIAGSIFLFAVTLIAAPRVARAR